MATKRRRIDEEDPTNAAVCYLERISGYSAVAERTQTGSGELLEFRY